VVPDPRIPPDGFWTDLAGAVRSLGITKELPTGETQLILPVPGRRHVTLLYPDGRPKPDLDLNISIYLWDQNHCGFHEGLPSGRFRTDAKGTIQVLAPLVPLYIDGLEDYVYRGTGPAGPAYASNMGMKIPADQNVVAMPNPSDELTTTRATTGPAARNLPRSAVEIVQPIIVGAGLTRGPDIAKNLLALLSVSCGPG